VRLSPPARAAQLAAGVASIVAVPLIKAGRWVSNLAVHYGAARRWTADEIALIEEVAERMWATIERARAEEALRESEARYRGIVNQTLGGIAETDLSGRFLTINNRYCEITGYARQELLSGMRMQDITHADDLPHNLDMLQRAATDGTPFETEKRYIRKDGSLVWVHNSVSALLGGDGKPNTLVAVVIDITERKAVESDAHFLADLAERIRHATNAEELLEQVTRDIGEYVRVRRCMVIDIDTTHDRGLVRHQYCRGAPPVANEYQLSAYSTRAQATIDTGYTIVNHDSQIDPRTAAIYDTTYRAQGERAYIAVPLMRGGRWNGTLWVSDDVPRMWELREISLLETVAERVWLAAEKLRTEQALRASEARFRTLANSMPTIVWMAAPDGTITYANMLCFAYCGLTPEENAERWPELVPHPDDRDRCLREWTHALRHGLDYEIEVRNRRYDGVYRWFLTRAVPIRDEAGSITAWYGTTTDIHERKLAEEEHVLLLEREQQARAEAQEAVRTRDVFLSIASHELKTPLTSLLGNAQLLQRRAEREDSFSERTQRSIKVINDQASRLNKMIAALLDISRIEQGQLSIDRIALDLCALTERVVAEVRLTVERHTIVIESRATPLVVLGDELRLEQVLQNLLQNAIKYSPNGGTITVQVMQHDEQACISISDQGMGIPAAALPNLFRRFYRANNVEAEHISGMGIGLFVVKEIVALHGGTVHAESTEGKGSRFTLSLPIKPAPAAH
jgi:PAS domain S-box-containing protein